MKSSELTGATTEQLIEEYRNAAAAHGQAILEANNDAANKAYDIVAACSRELRKRGTEAQKMLLGLLNDSDPEIRFCAAVDVLDFAPELGEEELTRLVQSKSVCGLNAYAILKQRGKANLRFP
jgi:hypothetical protein